MRFSCFPFCADVERMIRHKDLMKNDQICSVISFKEDQTQISKFAEKTDVFCTVSIEEGLAGAEALLLLDNDRNARWDKYLECIDYAIAKGYPVYASERLIKDIPLNTSKDYLIAIDNKYELQLRYIEKRIYHISTPIIVIAGMGESSGKSECQLELKAYMDSKGYKAGWFCSDSLAGLMGMTTLPEFLFADNISFPEKVRLLNRYIYDYCAMRNPDVVIINIPGALISVSSLDASYFSEIPLIISAALQVDCGIFTLYHSENLNTEYLKMISEYCENHYNFQMPVFYMSSQMLYFDQENGKGKLLFLERNEDKVLDGQEDTLVAIQGRDNSCIYDVVLGLLQENIDTV